MDSIPEVYLATDTKISFFVANPIMSLVSVEGFI